MTADMLLGNVAAYAAQVFAVVAAAALVVLVVRPEAPRLRLAVWQAVLALSILLPAVQPWRTVEEAGVASVSVSSTPVVLLTEGQGGGWSIDWPVVLLSVLVIGVGGRLLWLGIGLFRLRRYRLQATPLELAQSVAEFGQFVHAAASFYSSDDIRCPVTFGAVRPVVLLPQRFGDLATDVQRAVICHELLHVQRRDWLFTVAEEVVRAVLWFHPAIWWLIGQIQLTREQVVDREVLDWTGSREPYMEGLLAISGAGAQLDLAPAPLFLKKRHLNRRVEALLQERTMSGRKVVACLSLLTLIVGGAAWMVVGGFPLEAAPQEVRIKRPTVGIAGDEPLMHQPVVTYPPRAREQRIEGQVNLEVFIGENGSVYDARVLSGPEELRASALQAVLGWHYSDTVARPSTRVVTLNFRLPVKGEEPPQALSDMLDKVHESHGTVERIDIEGLPEEMRAALLTGLPIKEGEVFTHGDFRSLGDYLRTFDEHFRVSMRINPLGGQDSEKTVAVQIIFAPVGQSVRVQGSPGAIVQAEAVPVGEDGQPKRRIRVGGEVQASRLIQQIPPTYPPLARQARVEGTVVLLVVIGADGAVEKLDVEGGSALLVPAALEAVKQWRYAPTLLNGEPVEVATRVEVGFHLSE